MTVGVKRGRRFTYNVGRDGRTWWCAWRLFERVEGVASSELEAIWAIEHFLEQKTTYSQ